ncbi:hypothetical protein B0H10DRAFT_1096157 [Mycena sp. CBHHK59/15]|nr:hypothetical protein B0H10DRAFT_1096157 [Mycena sp. CBHHK59/15]
MVGQWLCHVVVLAPDTIAIIPSLAPAHSHSWLLARLSSPFTKAPQTEILQISPLHQVGRKISGKTKEGPVWAATRTGRRHKNTELGARTGGVGGREARAPGYRRDWGRRDTDGGVCAGRVASTTQGGDRWGGCSTLRTAARSRL